MSEESFLNQLQQVKKGKGSSRGKQTQKSSPRKENDDNNDEMEPVSAKREFLKDLQNDTDFIEFKKRTQFDDNGYKGSFGTPSVQKDFYIDKIKYGRVGDKNFNPEKYSDEDELLIFSIIII